jgi:hypothetical protein
MISLYIQDVNKGNLFSTMYCSLVVNPISLTAQPNIILSGLNHKKKIGEILEINSSHLWLQLPYMSPVLIHAIKLYAISGENLFSAKVQYTW